MDCSFRCSRGKADTEALTYLVAALSSLNVHNLTHLGKYGSLKAHKQKEAKEVCVASLAIPAIEGHRTAETKLSTHHSHLSFRCQIGFCSGGNLLQH